MCEYWNEAIKKITACNAAEGPHEKRTGNSGQLWPLTFAVKTTGQSDRIIEFTCIESHLACNYNLNA